MSLVQDRHDPKVEFYCLPLLDLSLPLGAVTPMAPVSWLTVIANPNSAVSMILFLIFSFSCEIKRAFSIPFSSNIPEICSIERYGYDPVFLNSITYAARQI